MDLLGIYLNDHLAGATAGVELARRVTGAHKGKKSGETFRRLAEEIAEDRDALLRIMRSLGVPVQQYKVCAGWIGEKIGRLKPNGHLTSRSPLSDLVELDAMRLGVEGKASGWRSLRVIADHDDRLSGEELDELLARAHRQAETLEELRTEIAGSVLGG